MANQHLTSPPTNLLRERLKVLLLNTNSLYQNKSNVLEEDIVNSYHEAINLFMKSLDGSITESVSKIQAGLPADPLSYNVITNSMLRDMEALFSEIGALDKIVVASFNSIISETDQVQQTSKRISNKLGDYLLYADPSLGGGYFFGDSFNSAERIDIGSSLVEGDECFLGQDEGVILLPLDGEPDYPKIKSYTINTPSNGSFGNKQELGIVGKDDIAAIGDNEPNTWFEYEKVSVFESKESLILDLTITLEKISIINFININPINFGTFNPVKIIKLETSKDGQEYRSISDDVPIKDFTLEKDDSSFELSSASNKFAGQGSWSFLPRKVQYVHIVFQQETPYIINTLNGERRRYAIGLRDINIIGRKFKEEGSIVSSLFNSDKDIRKISMWASENPAEASKLADIYHYLSENDGAVWRPIQPQGRSGFDIPEVINYNNISSNSVTTETVVNKFRHKIFMKRDNNAFQGDAVIKKEIISTSDLSLISGGITDITLLQKPIKETVRVLLPFYGSFSCPTARSGPSIVGKSSSMDLDFLEFSVDQTSIDKLRFALPFKNISNLKDHIRVLVNGEQIEYCEKEDITNGDNTSYNEIDSNSKVYFLNKDGKELQFSTTNGTVDDNGNLIQYGFLPPGGAKIQVCLDGDNPRLELTDAGYVLNLSLPSDGFKENMTLLSIDALSIDESTDKGFLCSPGLTRQQIPVNLFVDQKIVSEDDVETVIDRGKNNIRNQEYKYIAPVFNTDSSTWEIQEYFDGVPRDIDDRYFLYKVPYINGSTEFRKTEGTVEWIVDGDPIMFNFSSIPSTTEGLKKRYSFDPSSGILYLSYKCPYRISVLFKYNIIKYTNIPDFAWDFYKSNVSKKINTGKLVIDPKYVRTIKRIYKKEDNIPTRSIDLIGENQDSSLVNLQPNGHGWYKQRIVKGTISMKSLLGDGVKPVEVPFVDGYSELIVNKTVTNENISAVLNDDGNYELILNEINDVNILTSSPGFTAVRSLSNVTTPISQFILANLVTTDDPTTLLDNEWCYIIDSLGVCNVYLKLPSGTPFNNHTVEYNYTVKDPGVDLKGLFSVDYENGVIHFAESILNFGEIQYEVSTYSAFYNIAEVVPDTDIENIDEEFKKITLSSSLSLRMLKLSSALKARPSYARILYSYHKTSTESLKDIEKYFSPICKDVAFRAISSDILEEL